MLDPIPNLKDIDAVIQAVGENLGDFLLRVGRANRSHEHHQPEIHWIIGDCPVPYHNGVAAADMMSEMVDTVVSDMVNYARLRGVSILWQITPSMRPENLGARLLAHGFTYLKEMPGMAIELGEIPEMRLSPDVQVKRVSTDRDLWDWCNAVVVVYNGTSEMCEWLHQTFAKVGIDRDDMWLYVAYDRGQAVGTSLVYFSAGVAGLYYVGTIPDARGKGVGTAVTLAALYGAAAEGYQVSILHASEMGEPIYRRLGFQHICPVTDYRWDYDT